MNDILRQNWSISKGATAHRCNQQWIWACRGVLAVFAILAVLLLVSCSAQQPPEKSAAVAPPGTVTKAGYALPLFATAAEQLNYAKSVFSDPGKKTAALAIVIEQFADDRRIVGLAQLELAYQHLGSDYRRAGRAEFHRALAAYREIVEQHTPIAEVCAQAYWYMAWIYTDLLRDETQGLALYKEVADRYPDEAFTLVSPVPWLTLIFPDSAQQQAATEPDKTYSWVTYSWAASALLEIVRRDPGGPRGQRAFERLWQDHSRTLAAGYALLALLESGNPPREAMPRIDRYRAINTRNAELNRDLERAIGTN